MSQDIRTLFANLAKKKSTNLKTSHPPRPIIADSDDEEVVDKTPNKAPQKKRNRHKISVLSSDSEEETKSPNKKSTKSKNSLTPVNIDDLLNQPVRQTKPVKIESAKSDSPKKSKDNGKNKEKGSHKKKKGKNTELGIHSNKDFEETLIELDDDSNDTILMDNMELLDKTFEQALHNEKVTNLQENKVGNGVEKTNKSNQEKEISPKKRPRKKSEGEPTPSKKLKLEHTDSGIDPDQERWEKRRHSAALYQQYLHRGGPKHRGQKEYPKGKKDCLNNLTFLRTGVLDSLESEDFENLIKVHGGKVVHSVSKKVNYIVVGDQPGPSKLDKARKYNIKEISEDELLDLILVKSGMKAKYVVKCDSEDFGLGDSPKSDKTFTPETKVKENSDKIKIKTEKKNYKEETEQKISTSFHDVEKSPPKKIKKENTENGTESSQSVSRPTEEHEAACSSKSQKTFVHDSVKAPTAVKEVPSQNLCWTEKYKPTNCESIIGQKEPNSNMHKLRKWLENWHKNQDPERRKKMTRPSPFNPGNGEWYKAALLSGSPGVGKTTTATLVAKELGFDIVEFNASDTRNKRLLHEEIAQMMQTTTVAGFVSGEHNIKKKRILLMDEVDGMAGNEDRGGIAELINFIKVASFPIVCMCNNRDHQKMRTLVSHCYGLRFGKPNIQQIKGAMMSICFRENIKIKPDSLTQLIMGTGGDIRQTLNHLSMWSVDDKNLSSEKIERESKKSHKDVVYGPWDVIRKVFSSSENKDMDIAEKSRLFFYDYSLGPLFIQENYLQVTPDCTGPKNERASEILIRKCLAADSLSMGDMVESKIRSTNNWSLLESQAFYTTVLPSHYLSGTLGRTNFPSWLGKNSQRNKSRRIISELYFHSRTSVSGDKYSMRLDYAEPLRNKLIQPMKKKGVDGVRETFETMKLYSLLKEDVVNLCDLLTCFRNPNAFNSIDSKVKSALTRLCNKELVLSFAPSVASKKNQSAAVMEDDIYGDEEDLSDQETEDNIKDDALIKVSTKAAKKPATTSKGKGKGKANESKPLKGKRSK